MFPSSQWGPEMKCEGSPEDLKGSGRQNYVYFTTFLCFLLDIFTFGLNEKSTSRVAAMFSHRVPLLCYFHRSQHACCFVLKGAFNSPNG